MIQASLIGLSNVLFLLLFVRLWFQTSADLPDNPFLAPPLRWTERLIAYVRPALFFLPSHLIIFAFLLFLLVLRGALFFQSPLGWRLVVGATLLIRDIETHSLRSCLLFSLTSGLQFVALCWNLSLLVEWVGGRERFETPAREALRILTYPFSVFPLRARIVAAVLVNALVVVLLNTAGSPVAISLRGQSLPVYTLDWGASVSLALVRLALLTPAAMLDTVMLAHQLMVLLILTGLVSALLGNAALRGATDAWVALLLGRFGRQRILVGAWDLTPLVFLLLAPIAYAFVLNPFAALLALLG